MKPGYGRNCLIPQGIAVVASSGNRKMAEENIRQSAYKFNQIKSDAIELAKRLDNLSIEVRTKASALGKVYGSVTPVKLAEVLKERGIVDIDRKNITFNKPIKELGDYQATLILHKDVIRTITFRVVGS